MSWTNLKAAIAAAIKTNNNQEITGAVLQNTLNSIVNSVGANATFAGVATPSTNPGTPDGPVFYIAGQGGQYSNFGNQTITIGTAVIGIFVWDSSVWSYNQVAISGVASTNDLNSEISRAQTAEQIINGEVHRSILISEIDNLKTQDLVTGTNKTKYVVLDNSNKKVGLLNVISDNAAHVVSQIFVTHYLLEDGVLNINSHSDDEIIYIFRSCKINGGTLPVDTGEWTKWKYINDKNVKKWLNSAVSWTEAQKKQARANLGFGDGDAIVTTADNANFDLGVADDNGNVLMQLKDGHIKTKNFDSSKNSLSEADVAKVAGIEAGAQVNNVITDDTTYADLTLSDEAGNVVAMFKDGHVKTKNFDSKDIVSSVIPDNENPLSIVKETAGMTSIIHRLGVIGASFSAGGHNKTSGTFPVEIGIEFSWPQRLAALCGTTAFNFGAGGMWTKDWLDDTYGFYTAIADTDKKCDAYVISMSSNDTDPNKADYGLGTISDVHVGSESENGATYYGYLSKIVARCHEVMPRAYLFIMTYPSNYANMENNGYNQAMRDVCAAYKNAGYKMYLIDYARYGMTIDEAREKGVFRGAHYVGTGYQYMTYEICTYIDWIIRNNFNDFKDIAFVRTNAEYN